MGRAACGPSLGSHSFFFHSFFLWGVVSAPQLQCEHPSRCVSAPGVRGRLPARSRQVCSRRGHASGVCAAWRVSSRCGLLSVKRIKRPAPLGVARSRQAGTRRARMRVVCVLALIRGVAVPQAAVRCTHDTQPGVSAVGAHSLPSRDERRAPDIYIHFKNKRHVVFPAIVPTTDYRTRCGVARSTRAGV